MRSGGVRVKREESEAECRAFCAAAEATAASPSFCADSPMLSPSRRTMATRSLTVESPPPPSRLLLGARSCCSSGVTA